MTPEEQAILNVIRQRAFENSMHVLDFLGKALAAYLIVEELKRSK